MLRSTSALRPLVAHVPVASTSRAVAVPAAAPRAPHRRSFGSRQQVSWDDEDDSRRQPRRNPGAPHWQRDDDDSTGRSWSAPRREPSKGKKGNRQPRDRPHPPPSPEDLERYRKARVLRAERLERKDLTAQLTETKTCAFASFLLLSLPSFSSSPISLCRADMGGFTQPRHLQYLTTLDPTRKEKDSRDVRVGPNRIRPAAEAYEPHTVYLAVTRYPVRWGHGRQTRRECFSGFCRESELEARFRALNYGKWQEEKTELVKLRHGYPKQPVTTPAHWACDKDSKELLDLAVFPGSPEERSLVNKPAGKLMTSLIKERARTLRDAEPAAAETEEGSAPEAPDAVSAKGRTIAELDSLIAEAKARILPPVEDYTRPSPPYTSPPLVVPLLTITLPTRPLAATLARLSNGHSRGLPFIASIPDLDRKDGPALFRRLLRMRANRIQQVAGELVRKLEGYGGGLMGLRMSPEDRGRGIEGEGLGEVIVAPQRGWVEVSWLEDESACWEGIARDEYVHGWDDFEGAKFGPRRRDDARWATEHPLVRGRSDAAEVDETDADGDGSAPSREAVAGAPAVDEAVSHIDSAEVAMQVEAEDEAQSAESDVQHVEQAQAKAKAAA